MRALNAKPKRGKEKIVRDWWIRLKLIWEIGWFNGFGKKPMGDEEVSEMKRRERERERVDKMGMGKTHGRWSGEGDEETWVRENELDRRKDVVDLWVSNKSDVTIFGGS